MTQDTDDAKASALSAAHAAAATADFARANIERYLELHGGGSAKFVMKIADPAAHYVMKIADPAAHYVMKIADPAAHYVMKIADDALVGMSRIVDESAALAATTLQAFVDSRKARK